MNVLNLFRSRRSIRKYSTKEVSNRVLLRILEAARWAPSAHNAQPWHFITVREPAVKRELAEAMASRWNRDMSKNGVPEEKRDGLVKKSVERFTKAPIVVVACLTMEDMDRYPDRRRQKIEYTMAVQSVAAAVENMLLAAYAEGLGSCWFCAPLFCGSAVRRVLKIPTHVKPQALITMGYPISKPPPPSRKPLGEMVHQDRWRQMR